MMTIVIAGSVVFGVALVGFGWSAWSLLTGYVDGRE